MDAIIIDCETVAQPHDKLKELMPEDVAATQLPRHLEFPEIPEAKDIRAPGTYKDPLKILEYQTKQRERIIAEAEEAKQAWGLRQVEKRQEFIEKAPLDARYAEIKAIGLSIFSKGQHVKMCLVNEPSPTVSGLVKKAGFPDGSGVTFFPNERAMLNAAAGMLQSNMDMGSRIIGFNIEQFDLPMLIRRTWITDADPMPKALRQGRYFDCIDLLRLWQLGDRQSTTGGLDYLAKVLGVKRKTGDGRLFWAMYRDDPAAAIFYNLSELDTIEQVARKMGVSLA